MGDRVAEALVLLSAKNATCTQELTNRDGPSDELALIEGDARNLVCALVAVEYIPILVIMNTRASVPPLQSLAAKWRAMALILVALAKLMRRYEDGRVAGAHVQAEQLQIVVRTAQMMLEQEVAETLETRPPETEEDARALAFLRTISVYLLAVHLVLENVMQRGLVGTLLWRLLSHAQPDGECATASASPICGVQILDPG